MPAWVKRESPGGFVSELTSSTPIKCVNMDYRTGTRNKQASSMSGGHMSMMNYVRENPFRPPSWRWDLARHFIENGLQPAPGLADHWVQRAYRFQWVLQKCGDSATLCELAQRVPAFFYARELWTDTASLNRHTVEALIMAREPLEKIAFRCCIQLEVLKIYAVLFFDVADRLRHRGYVNAELIGPELSGPLNRLTFPTVLKCFAYHRGARLVDALLGIYHQAVPLGPNAVASLLPELTTYELQLKAALAAMLIPVNDRTAPVLFRLHAKILEIEHKTPEREDSQEHLREGIDGVLRDMAQMFGEYLGQAPDWLKPFFRPAA